MWRGGRSALVRAIGLVSTAGLLVAACGDDAVVDPRFAPKSYDEYTEPLSNAVIGSPDGITVISAAVKQDKADAGAPAPAPAPAPAAPSRDGGVVGDGGMVPPPPPPETAGFGFWHFDDCSAASHFLVDSSGFGANAQQPLNAACVPGIANLGVQIRGAKDVIQVPDEPQFTISNRITVAAWVHPDAVTGDQPIVIKRLNKDTSFSLGIHNGNIEMSVVLTTGKTFISRAPIQAGVWTHVAGMYDGTFVFLFINGQQFGQVIAGGQLRNVF